MPYLEYSYMGAKIQIMFDMSYHDRVMKFIKELEKEIKKENARVRKIKSDWLLEKRGKLIRKGMTVGEAERKMRRK